MTLKVIRYKNYGCQMKSEDDEDQFYFSFYELSNGEIIELTLFQSLNEGVIIDQYEFSYTKMKLKCGKIINYKFGMQKLMMRKECLKSFINGLTLLPQQ